MANINAQVVDADGHVPAFSAASASDDLQIVSGGVVILRNPTAAAITAVLETPGNVQGLAIPDRPIVVPATNGEVAVTLNRELYARPDNGRARMTGGTGLNVAILVAE